MSGTVNKAIIVGNLGKDPEIKPTSAGTKVALLSVATSESWRDKATGERKERTEWHRVAIFNEPLVKLAEQYLHKGSKVYLEGQFQTRKWTDQGGAERYSTEIVLKAFNSQMQLLDKREGAPTPSEESYGTTTTRDTGATKPTAGAAVGKRGDLDDEIPF